jgi:preprotein translocase subunit SecD
MKKKLLGKIVLIFLLTVICGLIVFGYPLFGKKFDLSLGLDLSGGSHLVFEANTSQLEASKKEQALKSLRNVIEKRVNLFGVSESNVFHS